MWAMEGGGRKEKTTRFVNRRLEVKEYLVKVKRWGVIPVGAIPV